VVGIAGLIPAIAGHDDVAIPQADPGVFPRPEIPVTLVARPAFERPWQPQAVALGDAPRPSDVPARSLFVTVGGGLPGEFRQALDAFGCDAHAPTSGRSARIGCVKVLPGPPVAPAVRVLHYLELEDRLDRSGIGTSVDHQRQALSMTNADVLTSPWRDDHPLWAAANAATGGSFFREFDLAHCNMIGPGSVAVARRAKRENVPLILHSHVTREDFAESFRGSNYLAKPLGQYLRWFYSQADLVLCPSQYTKGVLEGYPIDAPIKPITNGVDIDALEGFESLREEYRDRFDLSGMVVFAVGNVFERKGLTTFCELAEATDYDFAWFGPYDTGPQASSAVRKWTTDPPENVTFTGWIDDIRGAYGAGDVYLFPTKAENQGIAVLEAMAAGKAVVLRDIPVFREFYTDGEDCLLCSTAEEFREALDRLAANPELRDRLGENARETAREHSLDRVAEELAGTYNAVLAGEPERVVDGQ
jgi:1,2-diacylglycerol-3-alpha-glucose alpha-1,2-glucosyltransferase